MTDTFSRAKRSWVMSRVGSRDTTPELVVRRLAHRLGYRFRLCRRDLPGCPDIVFSKLHKVIFVHGCFWHGHDCARGARVPKGHRRYWLKKIANNRMRDAKNRAILTELGWHSLVIWECRTHVEQILEQQLKRFLKTTS